MTRPARSVLLQSFRGDQPGVTFYSLHPPGSWHGGEFPLHLFEGVERDGEYVMHGQEWEIVLWDVTFHEFPSNDSWRTAVDGTFKWIFDSGGVVAWIGDGEGYTAPPRLFHPEEMSNCVFEGRGRDGRAIGHLDLDAPVWHLDAEQLALLREASGGLASSE